MSPWRVALLHAIDKPKENMINSELVLLGFLLFVCLSVLGGVSK